MQSAADLYEHAVALNGLSKSWATPGLRLGWIVSQDREVIKTMEVYKDYTTICSAGTSEVLGLMALRNGKEILRRNIDILKKNSEILRVFFSENEKWFQWGNPKVGTTSLVKFLHPTKKIGELAEELVQKKGLMILPEDVYWDEDGPLYPTNSGGFFRLGYGRKTLPTSLNLLGEYIRKNLK